MLSYVYIIAPVVFLCAAIIGCGASVLWCSQGIIMTQCTNDTNKATYSGIFWGIFNLCVIPGNVIGHFILLKQNKPSAATTALSAVSYTDDWMSLGSDAESWAHVSNSSDDNSMLDFKWVVGNAPTLPAPQKFRCLISDESAGVSA